MPYSESMPYNIPKHTSETHYNHRQVPTYPCTLGFETVPGISLTQNPSHVEFAALQSFRARSRRRAAGQEPAPLRAEVGWATSILGGLARYEAIGSLLDGGLDTLAKEAQWSVRCTAEATATPRSLIGIPTVFSAAALPRDAPLPVNLDSVSEFQHAQMLFGGALTCGWPWALSLLLFSGPCSGWFSDDGRTFWSRRALEVRSWSHGRSPQDSGAVWQYGTVSSETYGHTVGVYFCDGVVVALCNNKPMRVARTEVKAMDALRTSSQDRQERSHYTCFYPAWLRLPHDERKIPGFPVDARHQCCRTTLRMGPGHE